MNFQSKRCAGPEISSAQLQTEYLDVRFVIAEKQGFNAAAELAGMPVTAWVRNWLRQATRVELKSAARSVPLLLPTK